MAGEPWLDSLSDDWEASSSSDPPSAPQSKTASSAAPQSRASRIPRYVSPQKAGPIEEPKDSNETAQRLLQSNVPKPNTLRTKSESKDTNPTTDTQNSKTTTIASVQSVIKHDGNAKAGDRLVPIPSSEAATPDWHNLALRQQDLFSPMGLEGIFQKPPNDRQSSPTKQSFSFYNDLSHMPSSPPPWPSSKEISSRRNPSSSIHRFQIPESLPEEGEQARPGHEQDVNISFNELIADESAAEQSCGRLGVEELEPTSRSMSALPGSSSSVSGGFSPVFISKHNTVDGHVGYAAFDPAALPKLGSHVNVERGGHSDADSFKHRPLSPSMSSSALPSDSLGPSDSVSQVRAPAPATTSQGLSTRREEQGSNCQDKSQTLTNNASDTSNANSVQRNGMRNTHVDESVSEHARSRSVQTVIERRTISASQSRSQSDLGSVVMSQGSQLGRSVTQTVDDKSSSQTMHPQNSTRPQSARSFSAELDGDNAHRRPSSVAGQKRKDAKYDSSQASLDPSAIASREILRPRNPTPWQSQGHRGCSTSSYDSTTRGNPTASDSPAPSQVSALIARPTSSVKARALALEAATFRQRQTDHRPKGLRQKSVSTQDYLNEAMRIMDLIRARKQATASEWSSNTGVESELGLEAIRELDQSAHSLSRPPSRDGPPSGWRTQRSSKHIDPRVESQLRKFEETGDESFLVSSIVRSVRITEETQFQHQQDGFRITDIPHREMLRRNSDPGRASPRPDQDGLGETRSSNGNTDGSGETHKTSSTQKTSSLGRIAPEHVSHLIRDEEAGMRFDTQRQTWVKCKLQRLRSSSTNVPTSSAATEDDPLGQIPDLSVHEPPQISLLKRDTALSPKTAEAVTEHAKVPKVHGASVKSSGDDAKPVLSSFENVEEYEEESKQPAKSMASDPEVLRQGSELRPCAEDTFKMDGSDAVVETVEPIAASDEELDAVASLPKPREKSRRREQSVLFSSPPVSREWDAKHWTDSTGPQNDAEALEDDTVELDDSCSVESKVQTQAGASPGARRRRHWSRNVSMSHTEEHQEISFVEQRPDGRTFSMSMSVSTPLPTRRQSNARMLAPSSLRHCSFMESLSPLSDFSVGNDNNRHVQSHALSKPVQVVERGGITTARSALATNSLVEKLTTAEPDEPYWDFMHRLSMADQGLDTLNMLDEFCPRLEELDVSHNRLQHLNGVPSSLRSLDMTSNHLNSMSDLSQLQNLQYINLSRNRLTTLTGFGSLVHLRELNLEHNHVSDIEGILDLDGLITVNLKHNDLSSVDFSSAQLRHLTSLDLSCNQISTVTGVSALPVLKELNLGGNQLREWPCDTAGIVAGLNMLNVNDNKLTKLDASCWPTLRTLLGNNNSIRELANISAHTSLQTLYLCDQTFDKGTTLGQLDDFHNLTDLHLSGTSLGSLLPLSIPFVNLRSLDVSFTGIQALPGDFGTLVPNLQTLNLNSNNLKDLRPLEGIVALRKLHAAQNRLSRLRNFVKVLNRLGRLLKGGGVLAEVDARGNPLTVGFYTSTDGSLRGSTTQEQTDDKTSQEAELRHLLSDQEGKADELHVSRLDGDTKMKRRVYEMLVGSKCPKLTRLDGIQFQRDELQRRDEVWESLVEMGVVRKVD